jgi:hypothetical protein
MSFSGRESTSELYDHGGAMKLPKVDASGSVSSKFWNSSSIHKMHPSQELVMVSLPSTILQLTAKNQHSKAL